MGPYHLPQRDVPQDVNGVPARQAMGMPARFRHAHPEAVAAEFGRLSGAKPEALVLVLEDRARSTGERLAAGHFLGLIGDPRVVPLDPAMDTIPGARPRVGTEIGHIDETLRALHGIGVKREYIEKECPPLDVELEPYRIGLYPVTNHEYAHFLADTGLTEFPSSWFAGVYPWERSNHPVHSITASQAEAYCEWLSVKLGRGFRLPREHEWEYAAAGPERLAYPWGQDYELDRANTLEMGVLRTTPIGTFPAGVSPFGLHDMGGNVEEFVSDDYEPYEGGSVVNDDLRSTLGGYQVLRGGCFSRFRDLARTARRHGPFPLPIYATGFRLAEDIR